MATVLVVDDSATDCRLVGAILKKNPAWNVVYANGGKEAMAAIELHLPDLVLTDLVMPEMGGLDLVLAVKEKYPLIPVVLMTAQGNEEIAVQALEQGAASYVAKRRLAEDLRPTVERVLDAADVDRSESRLMHRATELQGRFTLETELGLVLSVVDYVQDTMMRMRFGDHADCMRVGVGMQEALVNAYYHGNLELSSALRDVDFDAYCELALKRIQEPPYCKRKIYVEASFSPQECRFVIRDEGPGFDPSSLPSPTDPANLYRASGRGLCLMRLFMDEVRYNEAGTEVTLVKRRSTTDPSGNGAKD